MKQYLLLLLVAFTFQACNSAQKSFNNGNYAAAVDQSVRKLRSKPNNKQAKRTLIEAYTFAKKYHVDQANAIEQTTNPMKWDQIFDNYSTLNQLADKISTCPACYALVKPDRYDNALNIARNNSAEAHYNQGLTDLKAFNRNRAKDAYNHFLRANDLIFNYKESKNKIEEARQAALLRVVVERIPMHSRTFQLSNEFFENQIMDYLYNLRDNPFVQFYAPEEANRQRIKADHFVVLRFDDFVVGQMFIREKEQEIKRDSVPTEIKLGGQKKTVYQTVTATYITITKTVSSSGLLDFQIFDATSNAILTNRKFPGTFNWQTQWARYRGDIRALNKQEKDMCNISELPPPPPQQLFIEFTKPIYNDLTPTIRNFYRNF